MFYALALLRWTLVKGLKHLRFIQRGYPYVKKFITGFIKIPPVTLVVAGNSGPPDLASYAAAMLSLCTK